MVGIRRSATVLFLLVVAAAASAQDGETAARSWSFRTDLAFGVVSFEDTATGESLTYQQIALRPDVAIGPFGVGLNLAINYRFTGGDGSDFEVREEDWVPSDEVNFLELYLPKIDYVRYGRKGDPLFVQFGSFSDATLGNGFIMDNYSNQLFQPERRVFGAILDIDGRLVGFPYVGIETLTGNVAAWDVIAGRLYARPLAGVGLPLLPNLQIGTSFAVDRDPFYHVRKMRSEDDDTVDSDDFSAPDTPVMIGGIDTRLPVLTGDLMNMAVFGDVVWQEDRIGTMIGAGGRLAGFLLYQAQIRRYEDNFIPTYFDYSYDRRRAARYTVYTGDDEVDGAFGWLGRLGFSLLGDSLVFLTTVSGPFETGTGARPELRGVLTLAEGTVPGLAGFSFDARYEKFDLKGWDDLVSAENAIIGSRFNIRSGPVIVTLAYDLMYDPLSEGDPWTVSSGLETTISF